MSTSGPLQDGNFFLDHEAWHYVRIKLALTPRQASIVGLILCGYGDQAIADKLRCGVPTIRSHLTRVFRRLDVPDRIGVILRVFKECQVFWKEQGGSHPQ